MFWATSFGPTWFHWFQTINPFHIQNDPGILSREFTPKQSQQKAPEGIHKIILNEKHAEEVQSFLNVHFQLQKRCRFIISQDTVYHGFKSGWLGVGLRDREKELVACVISKPASSNVEASGVVDFFCVASHWRKKGLASYLLQEILRHTMERKRYIHYFLKEGYPLLHLPALYSSRYIYRIKDDAHYHRNYPIKTSRSHGDSQIYTYTEGIYEIRLCVVNHYHCSVPEGWTIGEIFWIESEDITPKEVQKRAVESMVDSCNYNLILMDVRIPHHNDYKWKSDSSYSWYIFNYNPGIFYVKKPFITY